MKYHSTTVQEFAGILRDDTSTNKDSGGGSGSGDATTADEGESGADEAVRIMCVLLNDT